MIMRFPSYTFGYAVAPLAVNPAAHQELEEEGSPHWFFRDGCLSAFPGDIPIKTDEKARAALSQMHDYDVLEIFKDGTGFCQYDSTADDAVLFVTELCNSNCVMCPMPEGVRRHGHAAEIDRLILIAKQIPSTAPHITVTGGEPFMAGKELFRLLNFCRSKFERTEFLLLTNARALAIPEYSWLLAETLPDTAIVGVPLHGAQAETHDRITRSSGSFQQTMAGLLSLRERHIRTELRIVVNKLNCQELSDIAQLIANRIPSVEHVCFMAMEMTGEARKNVEKVWVPYSVAFESCKEAIRILLENGINVRLYNFPLCMVDPAFRTVCKKSISPEKVRFSECCEACTIKDACGGVFAGTLPLVRHEMNAIR